MGHRLRLVDIARLAPDHDAKLHFPIRLQRPFGNDHIVIRAADGRGGLHEQHRFWRYGQAGFRRMVGIVQPDTDEFPDPSHAGPDPGRPGDNRQAFGIDAAQMVQPLGRQHHTGDVIDMRRQIPQMPAAVQNSGFLCPDRAIAQKFHVVPQMFVQPPSMAMAWPVMKALSSLAR